MSNNVALHFIQTTPPITRVLVLLTIVVSLSVYLDLLAPQQISYSRFYLKDLELHRIFTTFFYYGRMNFELVMNFIFLYRYSSMLEESYGRTSEYLHVILLIFLCLFITSNVLYIPFLGTSLSNTITYLWTRKNPQSIVQIFGFVSFSAFYLPFIFPVVTLIFEGNISKDEIVGIAVGHIIFYFTEVYPKFGKSILRTPCVLHRLFKEECDLCLKKQPVSVLRKKIEDFRKNENAPHESAENAEKLAPSAEIKDIHGRAEPDGSGLASNEEIEGGEEWEETDVVSVEERTSESLESVGAVLSVESSGSNKEMIDQKQDGEPSSEVEEDVVDQLGNFESEEIACEEKRGCSEMSGKGEDFRPEEAADENFESEELEGRCSGEDENSWQSS